MTILERFHCIIVLYAIVSDADCGYKKSAAETMGLETEDSHKVVEGQQSPDMLVVVKWCSGK